VEEILSTSMHTAIGLGCPNRHVKITMHRIRTYFNAQQFKDVWIAIRNLVQTITQLFRIVGPLINIQCGK